MTDAPEWIPNGREGASRARLHELEASLGVRLPAELRSLLELQDGGVLTRCVFVVGTESLLLPPILGADEMEAAARDRELWGVPPRVLTFASLGHTWWGLDYASPGPSVLVQYAEDDEIETVAPSFSTLIRELE